MNLNRLTLTWTLLVDADSMPLFGTERDVNLKRIRERIQGIWTSYRLGVEKDENQPYVWTYRIFDEHGRTFEYDWCMYGTWADEPSYDAFQQKVDIAKANGIGDELFNQVYPTYERQA